LCFSQVTPTMYSPSSTTMEITNSGGLTHCFLDSLTEHLSGIIIENQEFTDINLFDYDTSNEVSLRYTKSRFLFKNLKLY